MYSTGIANARTKLDDLVSMVIENSEVISISTENGNAVLISEDEYNAMIETVYLTTNPKYRQSLMDGKNTPLSDCIDESDVSF